MKQVVIENPILNSPYIEPRRHFRFTEEGITDEIVEQRRTSSYFIPIPQAKKKNPKQLAFDTEWTADRIEEHAYIPDFIVRLDDGHGADEDWLNLIVEVSGERRKDKAAKVAAARNLWIPAINNHGGFGRWAFVEISDPWDAQNTIRAFVQGKDIRGIGPLFR